MKFIKILSSLIIFICFFQAQETKAILIPEGKQGVEITPILEPYVAKEGDSLWNLAQERIEETAIFPNASPSSRLAVINAIKNAEVMINDLEEEDRNLIVGQTYQIFSKAALAGLIYSTSKTVSLISPDEIFRYPENREYVGYFLANPSEDPDWQELKNKLEIFYPGILTTKSRFKNQPPVPPQVLPKSPPSSLQESPLRQITGVPIVY